jgi:hypothetical protein
MFLRQRPYHGSNVCINPSTQLTSIPFFIGLCPVHAVILKVLGKWLQDNIVHQLAVFMASYFKMTMEKYQDVDRQILKTLIRTQNHGSFNLINLSLDPTHFNTGSSHQMW